MAVDRRQLIIEAATQSFSKFGYKATTMDQVAKAANVGKGTIYTFFENKEDLFDVIISTLIKEMRTAAEEVIDDQASLRENVHRSIYRILEFRKEHQLTIKLFQEEREIGTPKVLEVIRRVEKAIISFIQLKLDLAMERGEIKTCNSELTAFVAVKLYVALIFDWERYHDPLSKEEIAKLFELYLFEGLSV
ncbi:TetR/AcrR family transcriptional regulator [Pullulanibacillus sp. KACC 23026]|uniref:TetR/AcrR family transcriptional regulator n=1 Tax=Pullulanibacillus sp. KACC 23026 TaxID=3028315 RepID=UPI0023AF1E44|nr:TetR/AcrR family transcriptional regulator [Pullulanibacillus sp. KACC 23026]WEG12180.1 TetR/AcrR family transcriptional regulator [Pullulanibacillus sp. KACC 23026]